MSSMTQRAVPPAKVVDREVPALALGQSVVGSLKGFWAVNDLEWSKPLGL